MTPVDLFLYIVAATLGLAITFVVAVVLLLVALAVRGALYSK